MPVVGEIEVVFSPDEGAEGLVVKVIDSAKSEIRMLAYSFTSAPVVSALVADQKSNLTKIKAARAVRPCLILVRFMPWLVTDTGAESSSSFSKSLMKNTPLIGASE